MTKTCVICEKTRIAGRRIQQHHSIQWRFKAHRTPRVFNTNTRNANIVKSGEETKSTVCMKCYKKLRTGKSVQGYSLAVAK